LVEVVEAVEATAAYRVVVAVVVKRPQR
jgi:hypothetical protein